MVIFGAKRIDQSASHLALLNILEMNNIISIIIRSGNKIQRKTSMNLRKRDQILLTQKERQIVISVPQKITLIVGLFYKQFYLTIEIYISANLFDLLFIQMYSCLKHFNFKVTFVNFYILKRVDANWSIFGIVIWENN